LALFTFETAVQKVRLAEDGWNKRGPQKVAMACTAGSQWRNRAECFRGRDEVAVLLTRKSNRALDYRLTKENWAFSSHRIAERFAGKWTDVHPGLSHLGL